MGIGAVREIWRYPVKSMAGERLAHAQVGAQGLWGDRGWAIRDETTGEIHNAKRHPILLQCAATYRTEPGADSIPHVEITLPDGAKIGSDSPDAAKRLSDLMGRSVTLRPLQPAADKAYYRRRDPGAALLERLWSFRPLRALLQKALVRGKTEKELRQTFGREPGEPLPDLTDIPAEAMAYYTPPGTYFDVFPLHVLTTSALDCMTRLNPSAAWDVRRFRPNVVVETDPAPRPLELDWVGRNVRIGGFVIGGHVREGEIAVKSRRFKIR